VLEFEERSPSRRWPLVGQLTFGDVVEVGSLDMSKPRWELVITGTREEQISPPSDTAGLRPQLFD
jgi:hypothetical protein